MDLLKKINMISENCKSSKFSVTADYRKYKIAAYKDVRVGISHGLWQFNDLNEYKKGFKFLVIDIYVYR